MGDLKQEDLHRFFHCGVRGGGFNKIRTLGNGNKGSLASGGNNVYPSLIEWIYFLKGVIATLDEKNQSKDVKIKMLLMSKSNYSGHAKINLLKDMMQYDSANTDELGDLL